MLRIGCGSVAQRVAGSSAFAGRTSSSRRGRRADARMDSTLNLDLHFHALVLDGAYASPEPLTRPRFHPAEPLSDRDVEDVTVLLHRRIRRHPWRTGPLRRNADELEPVPDEALLAELYAASVHGRGVLAERGESALRPIAHRRDARPLSLPGELCASLGGLSLHAKVALEADDHEGRERLARYLLRPPIASERLSLDEHGRVVYRLRRHWNDGTRAALVRAARIHRAARGPGAAPQDPPPDVSRGARPGGRMERLDRAGRSALERQGSVPGTRRARPAA